MTPATKYPDHLERWREAARIAAEARELGVRLAVPGASRRRIAEAIEGHIRDAGAAPAFPANLSRNAEAAHYTPDDEDPSALAEGDLLKVDVGAHIDGAVADTADTVEVGGPRRHAHLVRAVHDAVAAGIAAVRPGGPVDDVSRAIASAIRARGLKPVVDLTGHTIERYVLHAGKSIPNVPGATNAVFVEGEIVAIEPFATNGVGRIDNGPFGHIVRFRRPPPSGDPVLSELFDRFRTLPFTARWARSDAERAALERARRTLQTYPMFVERAGGLVAQAEHTILVGPDRAEVLSVVGAR
ncbi:MAG TPA: type II methionyl aminopeptidase [Thermoplasmata archaeon]|nr:type II methionyl aminopeptidase [Thermoplasmata archaeon]